MIVSHSKCIFKNRRVQTVTLQKSIIFAVFLNLFYLFGFFFPLCLSTRKRMLWVHTKYGYFRKIPVRESVTRGEHHSHNILYFIIALSEDANGDSKSF